MVARNCNHFYFINKAILTLFALNFINKTGSVYGIITIMFKGGGRWVLSLI